MNDMDLRHIDYRKQNYGVNGDDNIFRCFNCRYGSVSDASREKVICSKWNMVTDEDATCRSFEFSTYWAFDQLDEDRIRRKKKLEEYAKFNKKVESNNEGCYIATAVYGGYDKPEVMVLRKFRDQVLKKNFLGRTFIKLYYALSPSMAEKLKDYDKVNKKVKCLLDKFVKYLKGVL